jgi:hypothetical protein
MAHRFQLGRCGRCGVGGGRPTGPGRPGPLWRQLPRRTEDSAGPAGPPATGLGRCGRRLGRVLGAGAPRGGRLPAAARPAGPGPARAGPAGAGPGPAGRQSAPGRPGPGPPPAAPPARPRATRLSHGWRRPRAPWEARMRRRCRAGRAIGAISTRRLRARPSASALEATGCCAPKAAAKTWRPARLLDQRPRDGQRPLGGKLPVVGKGRSRRPWRPLHRGLAAGARAVVGEAADHQHLVAGLQVGAQRRGQALEQLAPLGQIGRVEGEQHAAGDADAAVVQRHPPGGQRARACSRAWRRWASS